MLRDNPKFILANTTEIGGITYNFYTPAQATDYHMSRHVEATRQAMYASAGATEEVINAHLDAIIDRCNLTLNKDTFRTDVAAIANALKYRTKYPVDQHCAIRMGAILTFLEYENKDGQTITEDPNKTEFTWLDRKEKMAFENSDLYTFFLTLGFASAKEWSPHLDTLKDAEYFRTRAETLRTILPSDLLYLSS